MTAAGLLAGQAPATSSAKASGDASQVCRSGVESNPKQKIAVAEGQNILDAALEAGANVPFACKGGVCATCKAKLIKGEADMTINYGLEDDEVAAGYILTCQAHVKSDTAIVDFDV